jgi:hypothetical protein
MSHGSKRRVAAASMLVWGAFAHAEVPPDLDAAKAEAPFQRGQVTRLVVSSRGGDTVPGRRVGQWVRDMGLLVEVEKVCFSSCANYIFPAGRGRVLRSDLFVGWHGNERAFEVDARRAGKTLEEFMRPQFEPSLVKSTPEERDGLSVDAFFASQIDGMRQSIAEEGKYFAQLGLDDAFAACGVGDVLEKRPGFRDQWGWGFSIADMERLGLAHTSYLGDGAYEANRRFQTYLNPLTAEECVSLLR